MLIRGLFLILAFGVQNFAFASSYSCTDQNGQSVDVELPSNQAQLLFKQPNIVVNCSQSTDENLIQTIAHRRGRTSYRAYGRGYPCWSFYCAYCRNRTPVYPMIWQSCR